MENKSQERGCCEKCAGNCLQGGCICKMTRLCPCHTPAPLKDSSTGERKECTSWMKHDHWCDCGRETCWEEQLRLRVNFDKNQDREVAILFIHRVLSQAIKEERGKLLKEIEAVHDICGICQKPSFNPYGECRCSYGI